jgi:hypothetical protein
MSRARDYVSAATSTAEQRREWGEPKSYILLMPGELLEIPLWDEERVLTMEPDYLSAVLGLTDELIVDLIEWGLAYAEHEQVPSSAYTQRGAELAERLRAEVGAKYPVRVGPFR